MNYYGIYQYFIDWDYQEVDVLVGIEKANQPVVAMCKYLRHNVSEEKRDFIKEYLRTIECSHDAFYKAQESGIIAANKERLIIWAGNK